MTYEVLVLPAAQRQLKKLDTQIQERLIRALSELGQDPRGGSVKRLTGSRLWRKRIGDYRIIYSIHDGKLVVEVVTVGHRSHVYKG